MREAAGRRGPGGRRVARPRGASRGLDGRESIILEARHLSKSFPLREGLFRKREMRVRSTLGTTKSSQPGDGWRNSESVPPENGCSSVA